MSLEPIIRPFSDQATGPTPFVKPGAVGVPPVRIIIGLRGGTKTFATAGSASRSTRIGHVHKERAPVSSILQNKLASTS